VRAEAISVIRIVSLKEAVRAHLLETRFPEIAASQSLASMLLAMTQ